MQLVCAYAPHVEMEKRCHEELLKRMRSKRGVLFPRFLLLLVRHCSKCGEICSPLPLIRVITACGAVYAREAFPSVGAKGHVTLRTHPFLISHLAFHDIFNVCQHFIIVTHLKIIITISMLGFNAVPAPRRV